MIINLNNSKSTTQVGRISIEKCLSEIKNLFENNPDIFKKQFNAKDWKLTSKKAGTFNGKPVSTRVFEEESGIYTLKVYFTSKEILGIEHNGITFEADNSEYVLSGGKKYLKSIVGKSLAERNATLKEMKEKEMTGVVKLYTDDQARIKEDEQLKELGFFNSQKIDDSLIFKENQKFHISITNFPTENEFELCFIIGTMDNIDGTKMKNVLKYLNSLLKEKLPGTRFVTYEIEDNLFNVQLGPLVFANDVMDLLKSIGYHEYIRS